MGFREVLCVSFPGRPGDMEREGRGGLAFVMINIQADSHLEPRLSLPGFEFKYIYINVCVCVCVKLLLTFFWYFMSFLCAFFFSFSIAKTIC